MQRSKRRSVSFSEESSSVTIIDPRPSKKHIGTTNVDVASECEIETLAHRETMVNYRQELLSMNDPQVWIEQEREEIERRRAELERKKEERKLRVQARIAAGSGQLGEADKVVLD